MESRIRNATDQCYRLIAHKAPGKIFWRSCQRARRTRRRWRCSTAEKHHVSRGVVPTKVLRITNNAHHPSNNNNRRVGITTMASKVSLVTCLLVQVMEAGCSNFSGFRRRCSCSVLRRTTRLRLLYECPPHLLLLVSSLLDFFSL